MMNRIITNVAQNDIMCYIIQCPFNNNDYHKRAWAYLVMIHKNNNGFNNTKKWLDYKFIML